MPILATKLYIPPPRPKAVSRPHLIARLNEGLHCKLTLLSASAGFGKTTLVSEWIASCPYPVAWLSLDEGDSDPTRFLTYLIAALQTIPMAGKGAPLGAGLLGVLQSPQPPPIEAILTSLLNEITTIADDFVLVLDDYHVLDAKPIDQALTFLLEHLPPQMHLVITTREDPSLPLARYRGRGQLSELRAVDLRFTEAETTGFLNQAMDLQLSPAEIVALETRTEGWIAGLQLAAISLQGYQDTGDKDAASFIKSFTGSHRFVLDYLVEEVLHQQPANIQAFLLCTSILDRLCGPLCDAVLLDPTVSGQATLAYLEHANLFIVPLDNERRWYRYHHLFADFLRQRLHQHPVTAPAGETTADLERAVAEYHCRASQWYEDNGLEIEAFHHATAANDIARAVRLIEGKGMPLHFRGAGPRIRHWLETLSTTVLDAWPVLWTTYASVVLVTGETAAVEQKLDAAEAALPDAPSDVATRDLIGRIAAIRATLAATLRQVERIITQSRRALAYLDPENLAFRTSTAWKLGYAYQLQGDRVAATQAYNEVIAVGQPSGNIVFTRVAKIGLGTIQEADNQLYLADKTYRDVIPQFGDSPLPVACEAHLGLARICYEWNDLTAARQHVQVAQQIQNSDRFISCEVLLARLKLAQGDVDGAATILDQASQSARQHNAMHRMPEVATVQVLTLLRRTPISDRNLDTAAHLAQTYDLPFSQARVQIAQGDTAAALAVLDAVRQKMEVKGWADEILKVLVLQAVAHHVGGATDAALQQLGDALALAEPGGFIRTFVDEGVPMAHLLSQAAARGVMPTYTGKLLAAFEVEKQHYADEAAFSAEPPAQPLIEPLSPRELEILDLIAVGKKNQEIADELVISLNTVRYHTKNIYGKLGANKRTQAVAVAQQLGII